MDIIKEEKKTSSNKILRDAQGIMQRRPGLIAVSVISFAYSFWGYFTLNLSDRSLLEMFISGGISLVVAFLIDTMLRLQGIVDGGHDIDVVSAEKNHAEKIKEANPFMNYGDEWAEEETKNALKVARTHILANSGLRYIDYFDGEGGFKEIDIEKPSKEASKEVHARYKEKVTAITKARTFKVTPLTVSMLTSTERIELDQTNTGRVPSQYLIHATRLKGLAKVTGFFIFGFITFNTVQNPSWNNFFSGVLQVLIYLVVGLISYYLAYTFMRGEYRNGLVRKLNFLTTYKKFEATL